MEESRSGVLGTNSASNVAKKKQKERKREREEKEGTDTTALLKRRR